MTLTPKSAIYPSSLIDRSLSELEAAGHVTKADADAYQLAVSRGELPSCTCDDCRAYRRANGIVYAGEIAPSPTRTEEDEG